MFGNPMEIAVLVGAAVLLFGADRVPKLARSIGQAKKEFTMGQVEADVAQEQARVDARAAAEARSAAETRAVAEAQVAAETRAAAEAKAASVPEMTAPQTVNGVVVGAPATPHEPSAPPN